MIKKIYEENLNKIRKNISVKTETSYKRMIQPSEYLFKNEMYFIHLGEPQKNFTVLNKVQRKYIHQIKKSNYKSIIENIIIRDFKSFRHQLIYSHKKQR